MKIYTTETFDKENLNDLFTRCFYTLKDGDGDNFDEGSDQDFEEWFDIEAVEGYLQYSSLVLAEDDGNLVGGAIIGKHSPLSWPEGKKFELFVFGVLPEYRNKGIGTALLKKCEEIAKENGAKHIILNTHALMTKTQKYYERLGFTKIGTLKGYYDNGNAVFLMKSVK